MDHDRVDCSSCIRADFLAQVSFLHFPFCDTRCSHPFILHFLLVASQMLHYSPRSCSSPSQEISHAPRRRVSRSRTHHAAPHAILQARNLNGELKFCICPGRVNYRPCESLVQPPQKKMEARESCQFWTALLVY